MMLVKLGKCNISATDYGLTQVQGHYLVTDPKSIIVGFCVQSRERWYCILAGFQGHEERIHEWHL